MLDGLNRYVALKIKVDFFSGKRAGDIDPRDPGLRCYGWQNLEDGWEIRVVTDERDIEQYKGIDGVEVLEGVQEIDRAIEEIMGERMEDIEVFMPELFTASIIAKQLNPADTFDVHKVPNPPDASEPVEVARRRVLKHLMEQGVKGIRPVKRVKLLSELLSK